MKVVPIAFTQFDSWGAGEVSGFKPHALDENGKLPKFADELAEFSGRNCYQSWDRPNPATATNQGYLKNILDQGHFSVLEHASVSFYVEGVSRSLLTELERHRFLSFSVISQRYVAPYDLEPVIPPLFHGDDAEGWIRNHYQETLDTYVALIERAEACGATGKKQQREAARSVLPNATEVKMVVTGNIRAWRDVLSRRYHEAADAEIRSFSQEALRHLRLLAPNSFQDIPDEPYSESTQQEIERLKAALDMRTRDWEFAMEVLDDEMNLHCDPCLNGPAEGKCDRNG